MVEFRDVPWLFLIWISRRREVAGIDVCVSADGPADEVFARITEALGLLLNYDPLRYGRLRNDLRHILVTEASGGQYLPRIHACRIGVAQVLRESALSIAMTLAHEATHARLWSLGFRYDRDYRARIEQICTRAELEFAKRVPNSESEIATVSQMLKQPWWNDEQISLRSADELRRLGCPDWLVTRLTR